MAGSHFLTVHPSNYLFLLFFTQIAFVSTFVLLHQIPLCYYIKCLLTFCLQVNVYAVIQNLEFVSIRFIVI